MFNVGPRSCARCVETVPLVHGYRINWLFGEITSRLGHLMKRCRLEVEKSDFIFVSIATAGMPSG